MSAPVLILGWGNLSRGDDALGPLLLDALHASLPEALRLKGLDIPAQKALHACV